MIKTKIIETPKVTILVIDGLPEGKEFSLYDEEDPSILYWDYTNDGGKINYDSCELPSGEWDLIGFLNDISEDVAKELMKYIPIGGYKRPDEGDHFVDYSGNKGYVNKATQSLHSLVEVNCPDFTNSFLLKKID